MMKNNNLFKFGWLALLSIISFWIFFVFSGDVSALTDFIDPNGDGTVQATPTTCGGGGNFDCVNDGTRFPTAPATGSDFLTFANGNIDFYDMTSVGANSVSGIDVFVYHLESATNMTLEVSLFDTNETTQYGTSQNLTNRTAAQWDNVSFTGLSLTQTQIDNLNIRLRCFKSGGQNNNCSAYTMYAVVTFTANINVSASGTQTSSIAINTTNNYIGGKFVIQEQTSSRNITGITINENGTIDAQNHLDNIKLFYDLDTSAPYDCASETYGGAETQFSTTDTGGFSAANGISSFTGENITLTTTQTLCVYVVLDVLTGASVGETIEIEISNPSNDVTVSSGTTGPDTAIAISGASNLANAASVFTQQEYRIYENNGAIQPSIAIADVNTSAIDIDPNEVIRIRVNVEVGLAELATGSQQFKLQFADKGVNTNCIDVSGGSFADVGAVGSGVTWRGYNDTPTDGAVITSLLLPSSTASGSYEEANNSLANPKVIPVGGFGEWDWVVQNNGAGSKSTYCFRMVLADIDSTSLDSYTRMPEVTIVRPLTQTHYRWRNDDGAD